jgi:hypothetical protein
MPGQGVEWNEQISKDWGGQVMDDYLSAIDDVARKLRRQRTFRCVGAVLRWLFSLYLAEYITNDFKTLLHMMGFSIPKVCLELLKKFSSPIGILRRVLGKRQCCCPKTYTTFNPAIWLKNGTLRY